MTDTGIGIVSEKLGQIFQAFTQADGSSSRRYGGTGLGLAISSQLVQMMGGRIWVDSEPGKGSAFHFTARLGVSQRALAAAVSPNSAQENELAGVPVLIVDDNATNRALLAEIVTRWGMRGVAVDGALAAIEAMKEERKARAGFPLVVTDSQMPAVDGFALAEAIKQDSDLAGAAIMMLSSTDRQDDIRRCRDLGIAGCLVKPIDEEELRRAIVKALSDTATTDLDALAHSLSPSPATPSEPASKNALRILLAEDNVVNQKLMIHLLKKRGYGVTLAVNGLQVLDLLKQRPFDLILMDVQMPVMEGFETTQRIRQAEETTGRHLPIIALTAHAMKGDRERCLAAGMDDYLTKPIQRLELFAAVDRSTALTPSALSLK